VEIWMQQQASAVLIALRHAQELYGDPVPLRPFKPRPDSESHLGDGVL
jgi:hypothetical protein